MHTRTHGSHLLWPRRALRGAPVPGQPVSAAAWRYVYGPVPSRRLGSSLGVDLVPLKTCTYDCVYCQLGRTTEKTIQRREFAPVEQLLAELDLKLGQGPRPDYVTLAGSGEPTLYSGIGRLIEQHKSLSDVPVAVLTNGSLLSDRDVQDALRLANLVLPSLDAGHELQFEAINRPHPAIRFERMV